jgi:hypothetical protein
LTSSVYTFDPEIPPPVAVSVALVVPRLVGVPDRSPLEVIVSPGGRFAAAYVMIDGEDVKAVFA